MREVLHASSDSVSIEKVDVICFVTAAISSEFFKEESTWARMKSTGRAVAEHVNSTNLLSVRDAGRGSIMIGFIAIAHSIN